MELRALMLAGEQSAASKVIYQRPGVAPWNVNALVRSSLVVPDNGDSMGGVLARKADDAGETARSDVFEPDQTDSRDGLAFVELRMERRRQLALQNCGVNPEVHQQPSFDRAVYFGQSHGSHCLSYPDASGTTAASASISTSH